MKDLCKNPLVRRKGKKVYIINQHNKGVDTILVTVTPTASFTVGFNLTFTGSIDIDFKDGGGKEALTSGVEKTHLYASADTYVIEITGDLGNITEFVADNSNITLIEGMRGSLILFDIQNNLYDGELDMSLTTVSESFFVNNNTAITVIFATSGNGQTAFNFLNCGYVGVINILNVPVKTQFIASGNPLLTNVIYAVSGNAPVLTYTIDNSGLNVPLDLTMLQVGSISLNVRNMASLPQILFGASGNSFKSAGLFLNNLGYTDFTGFSFAGNNFVLNYNANPAVAASVNQMLVELYGLVSGEGVGGDYTGRTIFMGGAGMAAPDGSSGGYDGDQAVLDLQGKGITVNTN